jgi:endonuclease YncB( thermonuclease family)
MKAIAKRTVIKSTRHAAIVKRIVDGDTLILDIYIGVTVVLPPLLPLPIPPLSDTWLGMGLSIDPSGMLVIRKARARLYKFDAAEIKTPEGVIARDKLAEALPLGTEIIAEVYGRDKYGRWLVTPILASNGINVCLSL